MDEGVHLRHCEGCVLVLLPAELERGHFGIVMILFPEVHRALNQKASGPTAGIIDLLARFGIEDLRHEDRDFTRSIEFPGTLPGSFCEFPEQVLVRTADDIRFNISKAEPVFPYYTDQRFERIVRYDPLTCCSGIEIHDVNRSLEFWDFPGKWIASRQ